MVNGRGISESSSPQTLHSESEAVNNLFYSIINFLNLSLDEVCHRYKSFEFFPKLGRLFKSHFAGNPNASYEENKTLRFLGFSKVEELIKLIFKQLRQYNERYDRLTVEENKKLNDLIYRMLGALEVIMRDYELFDSIVLEWDDDEETNALRNDIDCLAHLTNHSQKYAHQAVAALHTMIFDGEKDRYKKMKELFLRDRDLFDFIAETNILIVLQESGENRLRSRSLAFINRLMCFRIPEYRKIFSTFCLVLPSLLEKFFQLQCDKEVILRMADLLYNMSTFQPSGQVFNIPSDEFMTPFIASNGFAAVTTMLSHESWRIVEQCLLVLEVNCDKQSVRGVNFRDTVDALLTLSYSPPKTSIVGRSLKVLWKIVVARAEIQEFVTNMRGPETCFLILGQPFPKPSSAPRSALQLLGRLLFVSNPLRVAAAHQILDLPHSKALFVDLVLNKEKKIDGSIWELLEVLESIDILAPERMKDLMFWRSNCNCLMADAVAHLIFKGFIDYDNSNAREISPIIRNKLINLVLTRSNRDFDSAVLFARYFGNFSSLTENPINWFRDTFDPTKRTALLRFLHNLADSDFPCLRSLPLIWAQHRQFEQIMSSFVQSTNKEEVRQSQFLMLLAKFDT